MVCGPRATQITIEAAYAEYNNNNYNNNNSVNSNTTTTPTTPNPLSPSPSATWSGISSINILPTTPTSSLVLTGYNPSSGLALSSFQTMISEMNGVVKEMRKRVERALVSPVPHDIMSYSPLRSFWLDSFGPLVLVVRLDRWLDTLETYLLNNSGSLSSFSSSSSPLSSSSSSTIDVMVQGEIHELRVAMVRFDGWRNNNSNNNSNNNNNTDNLNDPTLPTPTTPTSTSWMSLGLFSNDTSPSPQALALSAEKQKLAAWTALRYIDITTAHHLFRSVSRGCGWLEALRLVSTALNSNIKLLLPPPQPPFPSLPSQTAQSNFSEPSQIFQSNYVDLVVEMLGGSRGVGKPSQFSQSNSTAPRGWVGVSGVKGSGKTTALLHACHRLATSAPGLGPAPGQGLGSEDGFAQEPGLAPGLGLGSGQGVGFDNNNNNNNNNNTVPPPSISRDFVWIDLAGVSSDMEVISRIAQQLGLPQQVRAYLTIP